MFMDRKTRWQCLSVLPTLIYRFNMIPAKPSVTYFMDSDEPIPKFL